ncbi:uncharacterized protein LOC135484023 [Lineus longissimus]|uniref:uncharacterized protein LOC135484023 n=1 Tax=Lineus longissimus TaxID=88925 RepID=UPI00315C653D
MDDIMPGSVLENESVTVDPDSHLSKIVDEKVMDDIMPGSVLENESVTVDPDSHWSKIVDEKGMDDIMPGSVIENESVTADPDSHWSKIVDEKGMDDIMPGSVIENESVTADPDSHWSKIVDEKGLDDIMPGSVIENENVMVDPDSHWSKIVDEKGMDDIMPGSVIENESVTEKVTIELPNQDTQDSGTGGSVTNSCESLGDLRRGSNSSFREVFDANSVSNQMPTPLYLSPSRTEDLNHWGENGNVSSSIENLSDDLVITSPRNVSDWEDLVPMVVSAHNKKKSDQTRLENECRSAHRQEGSVDNVNGQPAAIQVGSFLGSSLGNSGTREFVSGSINSDDGLRVIVPEKGNSKSHRFENRVEPFVCGDDGDDVQDKKPVKQERLNVLNSTFGRRSSLESVGTLGLLMPVIPLVPEVREADTLSDRFKILQDDKCDLILAAAHIDDALKGRGTYGKARSIFKPKAVQRVFRIIESRWYRWLMFLAIITHSILVLFEPTQIHILPGQMHPAVITLEVVCVVIYIADIVLNLTFYTWPRFWKKEENLFLRAEFVLVCMFLVDLVMLGIQEIMEVRLAQPFRALRPFVFVCKAKNIAHMFEVSMSIALSLGKALFVILGFLLVFSAIGVHLFMDDYTFISCASAILHTKNTTECNQYEAHNNGSFDHIGLAIIRLFVLLTTENYPNFMLPAFNHTQVNFLYFGIFLYAGVFFLTPILVAIIVDSYWKVAKLHVKKERTRERLELAKAWNIMDAFDEGALQITDKKFFTLFHIIRPELTEEEINVLIDYIDEDGDGEIDAFEWTTRLTDALQYTFAQERAEEKLINAPRRPKSREKLHSFLQGSIVSRGIIILVVIYQVLFFLHWARMSWGAEIAVQILQSVIATIFLVESILRIIASGTTILVYTEILDIVLCFIAFVSNILWYLVPYAFTVVDPLTYHGAVVVLSSLAVLCRFAFNSKAAKTILTIFGQIAPVMFDLTVMVLFVLYLFAILGLEIFYGWTVNSHTDDTYASYGCGLGFDTFGCAMLVLFQILTTSNWHEIMNNVMLYVHDAAALYFIPCFFVLDMMIMNLVVAIAIEAFNKFVPTTPDEPKHNEEQSFGQKAKSRLSRWFASSREKPKLQRKTSLAEKNLERWSNPSVAGSRASISMARRLSVHDDARQSDVERALHKKEEEMPTETEVDSDEEDYAGLTIHERKERQLKRRMRQRKKKWRTFKVIAAFRKKSEDQINLHVGDEVKIIEKAGELMKGKSRGRIGWFPAKYVVEMVRGIGKKGRKQAAPEGSDEDDVFTENPTCKTNQINESSNADSQLPDGQGLDVVAVTMANPLNATYSPPSSPTPWKHRGKLAVNHETPHQVMQHRASSPQIQRSTSPLEGVQDTRPSTPKKKILQSQGDWRRRILGDITVMNQDEMLELNRIVRTKIRDKKRSSRQYSLSVCSGHQFLRPEEEKLHLIAAEASLHEDIIPEEAGDRSLTDTGARNKMQNQIQILVEESEGEKGQQLEEPFIGTQTGHHLRVAVSATTGLKRNRPKSGDGELPDWAKKLVATHNIQVSEDVKAPEENVVQESGLSAAMRKGRLSGDSASSILEKEVYLLKKREMTLKQQDTFDEEDKTDAGCGHDKSQNKSDYEKSDANVQKKDDNDASQKQKRIDKARKHATEVGQAQPVHMEPVTRSHMDEVKVDHFLHFISRPEFLQDVAYGTRTMKLSHGEKLEIQNVVRTTIVSRLIQLYLAYCEEIGFQPLKRSSLFSIIQVCAASQKKSLAGLDNIAAEGSQAFDTLLKVLEVLGDCGYPHATIEDLNVKIQSARVYLKTDFKLHVSKASQCPDHCIMYALGDGTTPCSHKHDLSCQRCDEISYIFDTIESAFSDSDVSYRYEKQREELLFLL